MLNVFEVVQWELFDRKWGLRNFAHVVSLHCWNFMNKVDHFVTSWFACYLTPLRMIGIIMIMLTFNFQPLSGSPLVIDLNGSCNKLDRFWTHTGFSPLDSSHEAAESLLLSKDEKMNLALISALPNRSISHVRIHWLLNLVYKKGSTYDWSKLDEVIDWTTSLKLNIIFEIMGLPNLESSPDWSELCSKLADHLHVRYGPAVVKKWIFELWNEPDLKEYNIANFTTTSYLAYAKSCINGIRSQIPDAVIGGPAGLFKRFSNHKLCWGFLEECNSLRNRCDINFISFHKKAFPEVLLAESLKLALKIRKKYPALSNIPFFNSEADLMSGWWKPRGWRGDVYYAAAIVKVVNLFIRNNLQNIFLGISNDNGFLNTNPFFFDQRTLITRFNFSSSNSTQFFKKPVYGATALLGKLENSVLNSDSVVNSSLTFIPSIDSCNNSSFSTIILSNLGKAPSISQSLKVVLPPHWGSVCYTLHVLSNSLDHPKKIWESQGSPIFPTPDIRELIRNSEEPHLILQGQAVSVIKLDFPYPSPSVGLIQICSKHVDEPQKIVGLKALNVSYNEVLLIWRDDSRCVSTYEVEYCPQESNDVSCFRRINKANTIMCSFQHVDYSGPNEEYVRGRYRVRTVNIWGIPGPYSSPHNYPSRLAEQQ